MLVEGAYRNSFVRGVMMSGLAVSLLTAWIKSRATGRGIVEKRE